MRPVLFVKLIQNYGSPSGVLMNSEAYSSYPHEAEMLLMEGVRGYILGFDEKFEISNKHEAMKQFNGKELMVIYMYIEWEKLTCLKINPIDLGHLGSSKFL